MLLLILVSVVSSVFGDNEAGCSISTNGDLGEPQPLIVNLNFTIRHPQQSDIVSFDADENFVLSCPNSYLKVAAGNTIINLTESSIAKCIGSKQVRIENTDVIFTNITCNSYPYHVARYTNKTCEEENLEIEIGFSVYTIFIRHLLICFDVTNQNTLWSYFKLEPSIRGRQSNFPRPSWINDNFYSFGGISSNANANNLYTNVAQVATISQLIGHNNATSNPYVNNSADLYLARGHLAAKADFVFGAQQRATFHMVNAAPQWQTFNGINWAYWEADARDLSSEYNLTLEVYTGTYGVMTLPHMQTGEPVEIYLYNDDNGNQQLRVPLLYWKYLYEPISQSGIVIIGVNNPYIQNISEAIVCKDIYDSINWTTTFTRNHILNGYMYACEPDHFRQTVTYLPNVTVSRLLTFNETYSIPTSDNAAAIPTSIYVTYSIYIPFFYLIKHYIV